MRYKMPPIAWGTLAQVGIFLAKAIVGVEIASKSPGAPSPTTSAGPTKREVVTSLVQSFLEGVAGTEAAGLLGDPEVLAAFNSANDAIVHFQNVLARAAEARALTRAAVDPSPSQP